MTEKERLQEQVTDGENWFGVGVEPASKAIIGSQQVPFIYEDRLNKEDFLAALNKIYEMSPRERAALGAAGREWAQKQFNFEDFIERWDTLFSDVYERMGSWETRVGYSSYDFRVL